LRFIVQGTWYRVHDSGCRVLDLGCRVQDSGYKVHDLGCRVQGLGCRVQDLGCRVLGLVYTVRELGTAPEPPWDNGSFRNWRDAARQGTLWLGLGSEVRVTGL
jgi:hypothetical protein